MGTDARSDTRERQSSPLITECGRQSFPTPDDAQAAPEILVNAMRAQSFTAVCIAATLDAFLMFQLGYENVGVYDASMSEWARTHLAVETG